VPFCENRNITVLIVDDEPSFRKSLAKILGIHGFYVVEADGPAMALESIADPQLRIDLALLDVILPGTSGFALADQIREQNPVSRVLFMSGYPMQILQERYRVPDGCFHILQKPLESKKLIAKILEVLERKDRG
jgi:CheY-like chemotaxis protein